MGRQVNISETTTEIQKNVFTIPAEEVPYKRGVGSTIFYKMLENGDKIAQTDGITGEQETFAFLLKKAIRAAIHMRSKGLTSDDVITLCSYHHLDTCVPYLAALFLGAKVASIDASIPLPDAVHLMKQVRPKMVFVSPLTVTLIENTLKTGEIDAEIVVFGKSSTHPQFSEFLAPSSEEENFTPIEVANLKDTAGIFFSSGTTGLPKGIQLSHHGLLGSSYIVRRYSKPGDSILLFSSYHWISSTISLIFCVLQASNRILYPSFDLTKIWKQIEEHKVNITFMAPMTMIAMGKDGPPAGVDLSSWRYAFIGGAPISGHQVENIRKCLPNTVVLNSYGQSEVSGAAAIFQPEEVELAYRKPDSPGKFLPGMSFKVVNPETEEILGPHQEGEIRVKTHLEMNGYYKLDSSQCWDADGFIKTGDVGYYDGDHCFFIVDRLKELMKYQMWQIAPAKLEGILLQHPTIQKAVVFGLPHDEDGDHPTAAVVLMESASHPLTVEDIEKFYNEKVDERERLRGGIHIMKDIPLTVTGKVSRMHMRKLMLRGEL